MICRITNYYVDQFLNQVPFGIILEINILSDWKMWNIYALFKELLKVQYLITRLFHGNAWHQYISKYFAKNSCANLFFQHLYFENFLYKGKYLLKWAGKCQTLSCLMDSGNVCYLLPIERAFVVTGKLKKHERNKEIYDTYSKANHFRFLSLWWYAKVSNGLIFSGNVPN